MCFSALIYHQWRLAQYIHDEIEDVLLWVKFGMYLVNKTMCLQIVKVGLLEVVGCYGSLPSKELNCEASARKVILMRDS
jgi:hypothetical protein